MKTLPSMVIVAAGLVVSSITLHAYERLQGPTEVIYWDKTQTYAGYTFFGVRSNTYQDVEIMVSFQPRNVSWVKFSKSSMGSAVTTVPTGAEIRPVAARQAARSARAGRFARSSAALQAAASRTMRSRLQVPATKQPQAWVRSSPRYRLRLNPPTILIQPKISSTRLRIFKLT
jgi:hypothetical protein